MEVKRDGSLAQVKVEKRMNVAVATFCMGLTIDGGRNRRMAGTDLSLAFVRSLLFGWAP
jgi:hypothetical protein